MRPPAFLVILLMLLSGCAGRQVSPVYAPRFIPIAPPLPPATVRRLTTFVPGEPFSGKVATVHHVTWSNYGSPPPPAGARWVTGVIGSTNLADWYEITNMPYASQVDLILYGRPEPEFYRAFNRAQP